jgi:hypothetical protein
MSARVYTAFGLSLSANRPIPGLSTRPDGATDVDADIWFGREAWPAGIEQAPGAIWYVSRESYENQRALQVWRLDEGSFRLLYADGTEFLVNRNGTEVWARWPEASSTLEDTATYLLGPVMALLLRIRGRTCLHGSAVALGKRAIALVGPPGTGKSTTAAAFSRLGYPALADDVVALRHRDAICEVQPAFPQLRLWPDSVALLYGTVDALPRLTPCWDKRALDLMRAGPRFDEQPLPLAAIYLLGGDSPRAGPRCEGLGRRESLLMLVANTCVNYLLDAAMRAAEFDVLTQVVSTVPVRKVAGSNGAHLTQLCSSILEDCEALGCTASPTTVR